MKERTSVSVYRSKQKVREIYREELIWMGRKFSELEYVKRIGMIVEACMKCASLELHQNKMIEVGKTIVLKIELKKENAHQNGYSGVGLVAHGV